MASIPKKIFTAAVPFSKLYSEYNKIATRRISMISRILTVRKSGMIISRLLTLFRK
jgi:hypothetical protein